MVVELAPLLDEHSGFPQISEPLPVQALVSQLSVEALNEPVVPGSAWRNERRADPLVAKPAHDRASGELRPLVRTDEGGLAIQAHQPREHEDHILARDRASDLDRQTLPGVFGVDPLSWTLFNVGIEGGSRCPAVALHTRRNSGRS